jgi:phosphate-selective porin OprO/OprP
MGVAIAWVIAIGLTPNSAAAADEELLRMLLGNGAITQDQYEQLVEKEKLTAKEFQEIEVSVGSKGLRAQTTDGQFAFKIGGRLHVQAAGHNGKLASDATNGTEIRRARFDLEGRVYERWRWKAEVDFADNDVSVKDFHLGYTGFEWGNLFVGHQKQPYSLALEMSSNDLPFIERGIDTDLITSFVDRAIGLRAESSGERWHVAGGIYGSSVDPERLGNEGWGAATRFVYAPVLEEDRVLHLGVRAAFREPSNEDVRIRSESAHLSNLFTTDTGVLADIDNVMLVGPEMALAWGPFSIGGEYNHASLKRGRGDDLAFDSWHAEATWSITGESRASSYKMGSGEFKRLQATHPVARGSGGRGAWELALRYASLDLDDEDVNAGDQQSMTLALNWYLNSNVRIMLDWSRILGTSSANRAAEDLDIFQTRLQFNY